MRESNKSVSLVEMAVGVWVVIETSGQGGFRVENITPGARRGPAAQHHCMRKLAERQPPGHDGAVWNRCVGSSASKNHVASPEGQQILLIVHGGQPPSLRMGVLRVRAPRLSTLGRGLLRNPTENVL